MRPYEPIPSGDLEDAIFYDLYYIAQKTIDSIDVTIEIFADNKAPFSYPENIEQ